MTDSQRSGLHVILKVLSGGWFIWLYMSNKNDLLRQLLLVKDQASKYGNKPADVYEASVSSQETLVTLVTFQFRNIDFRMQWLRIW